MMRIFLIAIVVLAGVLRIFQLDSLPSGFHSDEVLNGYVGRFTLQNGVDLYGNRFPFLYFDNFGDYPNILPMYLSGLSTYVFGMNEFAVRLPIALAGVLTVYIVYVLSRIVFKQAMTALSAAFILAISPWHIVLSRATAEGVTATLVFLVALYLFFRAIETNRWHMHYASYLCFGLTYFLYPSYRVLVPLVLLPGFLLVKSRKQRIILGIVAVLFFLTTLIISQTVWGKGRYDQTSVFTFNDVVKTRVTQAVYGDTGVPLALTRIFHNKYWTVSREIINQYFSYFSGTYLFVSGGLPPRYQLINQGLFPISLALVSALAVIVFVVNRSRTLAGLVDSSKRKFAYYLAYVLALSPLPAALTLEDVPNVHRSILLCVMLVFVFSLAITSVLKSSFILKKVILSGLLFFFLFEVAGFWHNYAVHANSTQAGSRHYEMKTLSALIIDHETDYSTVFAPTIGHLPLHYLFRAAVFDKTLAGQFGKDSVIPQVKNIVFNAEKCPSQFLDYAALPDQALIVDRIECGVSPQLSVIQIIKQADGHDAYRVSEVTSPQLIQSD